MNTGRVGTVTTSASGEGRAGEPPRPRVRRSVEFFPGGEYGPVAPEVVDDPPPGTVPTPAPVPVAGWTDEGPRAPAEARHEAAGAAGRTPGPAVPWWAPVAPQPEAPEPAAPEPEAPEPATGAGAAGETEAAVERERPAPGPGPERISIDELQARIRRPRDEEPAAGGREPGGRKRSLLVGAAVVGVLVLVAVVVLGTRSNWFAPVTGRVHTEEEIDRARTDAFEEGRRAGLDDGRAEGRREGVEQGIEQGRVEGREQGCRAVFDRAGSSTLWSGPGPRASSVRRQDCGTP